MTGRSRVQSTQVNVRYVGGLTMFLAIIVLASIAALISALGWWAHRVERDDLDERDGRSTISDEQRRRLQVGIGLTAGGSQLGGH